MSDDKMTFSGCLTGILELVGLFLAIAWPILLLFLYAADRVTK